MTRIETGMAIVAQAHLSRPKPIGPANHHARPGSELIFVEFNKPKIRPKECL